MNDCIYTAYCTADSCDLACTAHAEITYWMNHCGINFNNRILRADRSVVDSIDRIVQKSLGKVVSVQARRPMDVSAMLAYICICRYGQRKAFSKGIYVLNFADYLDRTRQSWQLRDEPDSLEMMRIWSIDAKYLIITQLDYVNFKDFECQTLLRLMQEKEMQGSTTFIVLPKGESLIGKGEFFSRLQAKLKEVAVE